MIAWMQKHKKYLVVTIWVSTIAFVAAGMIGWGQYNFSFASGSVAKVGRVLITQEELDMAYKQLVDAYSQSIPNFKDLDEKQIKAMGLERSALQVLINQALLKNLALDLGLGVSSDEIIAEIKKSSMFQKDGHFDEELYKKLLQENHYRPSAFEDNVKNALILQKISALFPKATTPLEFDSFLWALQLQDKVRIKILEPQAVVLKESDLQKYYEQHKNSYKKPPSYTLESVEVKPEELKAGVSTQQLQDYYQKNKGAYSKGGKLEDFEHVKDKVQQAYLLHKAQELALEKYLALKKNTLKPNAQTLSNLPYSEAINQKIEALRVGEVLKPQNYEGGWLVVKLRAKDSKQIQTFKEAQAQVRAALGAIQQKEQLEKEASQQVKSFQGEDIGTITSDFQGSIHDLSPEQSQKLVRHIFNQPYKQGYVILEGPKAVLYQIYAQDFKHTLKDTHTLKEAFGNLKAQSFDGVLVSMLRAQYPITLYSKNLQE
ncbi:peptidylprolyl isomerase [Helicobacter bizzozeronii]|uniref:peptidylprolyl isomerase n=1 Tax=Helicobacter bizzozeronii TaxID=56877 RepID=UPI000CF095E5|nr:peptidylprolyl isomerase [Helicobacter bizzozeronii]